MKSNSSKILLSLSTLVLALGVNISVSTNASPALALDYTPIQVEIPTTINLNRTPEAEVRAYYSSLVGLSANELKDNNLAKNLKPILKNNMTYIKYDDVWSSACITDRDWGGSPAQTLPGDYNPDTGIVSNYIKWNNKNRNGDDPYLHVLYRNDNGRHEIKMSSSHSPSKGVGGINREHVWCQSRGFKANNGAEGPAGTDLHHLIIGDADVNQFAHNNYPYGEVTGKKEREYENSENRFLIGNYYGWNDKYQMNVFEPNDKSKGDIARACFYMMARYNNFSGNDTITQYEPNLIINNEKYLNVDREDSSPTKAVNISHLEYLLKWHHEDPVDEYEIYRNDLIYNNFQHNRNPFIDFPSWADSMFGEEVVPVNPNTNKLNIRETSAVPPTSIKLNVNGITNLKPGDTYQLIVNPTPENATLTGLKWTSDNEEVATVSDSGLVTIKGYGTAKIKVATEDNTLSDECVFQVSEGLSQDEIIKLAIIGGASLIVLIILIVIIVVLAKKKKLHKLKKVAKEVHKEYKKRNKKK